MNRRVKRITQNQPDQYVKFKRNKNKCLLAGLYSSSVLYLINHFYILQVNFL